MSRAHRPADFEAFLRKYSHTSPSRQSDHADRLQLDRGSRVSSRDDRQSRDQKASNRDNSDRFRTTHRNRSREYSLRESEVRTLIDLGKFRVVPADNLARLGYRGDRSRMENDVQNLRRQGLIEQRSIEGHESYSKHVFTLTKEGHKLLSRQNLIPDRQAIHHGFVNPTQKHYKYILKAHLIPAFGEFRLSDISREAIQNFLLTKLREDYSWESVHHFRCALSKVLGSAEDWNYIANNPVRKTRLPRREYTSERQALHLRRSGS